ncbi:uncharacterized protein LOC131150266 [Malania oleifera]|uniref:uncharacterized protein LOC131150266 n=1 Tax=Malania oleifera TaxID=397392 RepID=UPI0025AE2345|nr:uncharacterized protein LOC131150266 [Malania oleifera]
MPPPRVRISANLLQQPRHRLAVGMKTQRTPTTPTTTFLLSMEPPPPSSSRRTACDRDKFVSKVLLPAIIGKSCPICLTHIYDRRASVLTVCLHAYCTHCIRKWSNLKRNCPLCSSHFDSWFCRISLPSRRFRTERLRPLGDAGKITPESRQMVIRRWREESSCLNGRSRPLPWRRSFGRPGSVHPDVVAERALQWRASIYNRRLQAVPLSARNRLEQDMSRNKTGGKERLLCRIEPWVRRELQAILGDPDPSVIVHVTTSHFISHLEKKFTTSSAHCDGDNYHLAPLRPFLQEWTGMFWHELRCFAESSFTMETYDTVVEYKRLE